MFLYVVSFTKVLLLWCGKLECYHSEERILSSQLFGSLFDGSRYFLWKLVLNWIIKFKDARFVAHFKDDIKSNGITGEWVLLSGSFQFFCKSEMVFTGLNGRKSNKCWNVENFKTRCYINFRWKSKFSTQMSNFCSIRLMWLMSLFHLKIFYPKNFSFTQHFFRKVQFWMSYFRCKEIFFGMKTLFSLFCLCHKIISRYTMKM